MIIPFLIGLNVYLALAITIGIVVWIIFVFNFYISVAKDLNFKKRFFEMVTISLGVAFVSFLFSFVIKYFLGV
jgi:VIT1/CCC1 family predicted Fe2+/Mn2+ transporter